MAFIRRGKVKKRATSGFKVVVVVGDDTTNNEVNTVNVSLPAVTGQPTPSPTNMTLPLKVIKANGNKRFVYPDLSFSDDAVNYSYSMTSTMKDSSNNQVGEKLVSEITVEDNGDARVRTVVIRQLDATNFLLKVVVIADSDDEVSRVDVEITDLIGNPAQPESVSMTNPNVNGDKKVFKMNTLTFEDPAGAADQPYGVVVSLFDSSGNPLGASDYEIIVEGLEV